jgi:hypothetical protein
MLVMGWRGIRNRWSESPGAWRSVAVRGCCLTWGLVLCVVVLAAIGAGNASASPVGRETSFAAREGNIGAPLPLAHVAVAGEVRLVGSQVLFTDGASELDSVLPGGVPSRLFTGPGPTLGNLGGDWFTFTELTFAASPALLAVEQYVDNFYKGSDSVSDWLLAGPLGGPFSSEPSSSSCLTARIAFAVSRSMLAYRACEPASSGVTLRVVLHDASAGGGPDRTLSVPAGIAPANGDQLAIAGDAVAGYFPVSAGNAAGEIVVWDATTGAVSYAFPVAAADALRLAVQSDQTVAFFVASTPGCGRIGWASTAQPSEHDVPGCAQDGVRLVGDRLAYVAGAPGAAALVTTDLNGANQSTALELGAVPLRDFDFDGSHLVSETPACDGGADYALEDPSTNEPTIVDPLCPATIPAQRPVLKRGAIDLAVQCPLGCHGVLTARTAQGRSLGSTQVLIPAGRASGVFTVALSNGLARYSHDRTLSIHLVFSASRLDGGATPSAQTVTLKLPSVIEHASLTGLAARTAKLRFDLLAGLQGAAARTITVTAPTGVAFARGHRALIRSVRVTSETGRRLRFAAIVSHGRLTIRLRKAAASAQIVITHHGIAVARSLARAVRRGRVRRMRIAVSETSLAEGTTRFHLRLRVS